MKNTKALLGVVAVLTAMVVIPGPGSSYAMPADAKTERAQPSVNTAPQVIPNATLAACPAAKVCLWTGYGETGLLLAWAAGDGHNDFTKIGCQPQYGCTSNNDFNDEANSWRNNTNMYYCVSWGINGGNPDNTMPPGTWGDFDLTWVNQASSIGFLGCP